MTAKLRKKIKQKMSTINYKGFKFYNLLSLQYGTSDKTRHP